MANSEERSGYYVYGVLREGATDVVEKCAPVLFGKDITVVPFKDVGIVVSEVALKNFDEDMLQEKLRSDPQWTETNVRKHHEALHALSIAGNTVIPCAFGVVFKTKENLLHYVADDYQRLRTLLSSLRGKEEWCVKVYLDNEKRIKQFKQHDKEARALERRKGRVPEGMAWYIEKKIDQLLHTRLSEELEQWIQNIVESLHVYGESIVLHDTSSNTLEYSSDDLLLNASCLIKKNSVAHFHLQWRVFFQHYSSQGLYCKLTGPWPPYNFVKPHV